MGQDHFSPLNPAYTPQSEESWSSPAAGQMWKQPCTHTLSCSPTQQEPASSHDTLAWQQTEHQCVEGTCWPVPAMLLSRGSSYPEGGAKCWQQLQSGAKGLQGSHHPLLQRETPQMRDLITPWGGPSTESIRPVPSQQVVLNQRTQRSREEEGEEMGVFALREQPGQPNTQPGTS